MFKRNFMDKKFFLNDLFTSEELLNRFFDRSCEMGYYPLWTPPVDIYETDEAFIVEAELPGVCEDDIDIKVEDNILLIRGVRRTVMEGFQKCHRLERQQGYFSRRFMFSSAVDTERISAVLKDGILTVVIPKKEAFVTRHIRIEDRE